MAAQATLEFGVLGGGEKSCLEPRQQMGISVLCPHNLSHRSASAALWKVRCSCTENPQVFALRGENRGRENGGHFEILILRFLLLVSAMWLSVHIFPLTYHMQEQCLLIGKTQYPSSFRF